MTIQPSHHHHEVDLEDSIDFINTLDRERDAVVDRLTDIAVALDWLQERGLVHDDAARACAESTARSSRALDRIRRVRGALRELTEAVAEGRPADADALAQVNRVLRAREYLELIPASDGVSVDHRHHGDPIDDALSRLAEPFVRGIGEGLQDRLRICANDECQWAFYDSSRTNRRVWCDMATCGNRAKAARHRARKKETVPAQPV
jgi:predicted RNA-binding Zn ribbon-like protein